MSDKPISSRSTGNPPAKHWKLLTKTIRFESGPALMGIVNVTPDSFSDGGKFLDADAAIDHALQLADAGATILDVGGESTRPYSTPVEETEERRRVIPVIRGIVAQTDVPVSIDTSKPSIAAAALDAGAQIINDVTGFEKVAMIQLAADSGAGLCAMHMQGTPSTMQDNPHYSNVVDEIFHYLEKQKKRLLEAGVDREAICLDPGIGFGKTHAHNLELLAHAEDFLPLGCPILIGHSRKGFLGKLLGDPTVERDSATLAITLQLAQKGIQVIRVHEVARTARALRALLPRRHTPE